MFHKFNSLGKIFIITTLISLVGSFAPFQNASSNAIGKPIFARSQSIRPPINDSYEILLRSRHFTPGVGLEPALVAGAKGIGVNQTGRIHVLVQFYDIPTTVTMDLLHTKGIELLNYIPDNAWFASMPVNGLESTITSSDLTNILRWTGVVQLEDKLPADIWAGQVGSWARVGDDLVQLEVSFFDDVGLDNARMIVSRHDGVVIGETVISNKLSIVLNQSKIADLALEDGVRWIDQVPPPATTNNDGTRQVVQVDQVQVAPYNLSGRSVIAGIWDEGAVDSNHDDFDNPDGTSRITSRTATVANHSTHVAGIMGGNGTRSVAEGGTDRQWRGMAPNIGIVSYDYSDPINDYAEAINTYHINLSQNSWGRCIADTYVGNGACGTYLLWSSNCGDYGDYRYSAPDFDRIVSGGLGSSVPVIFAAGNERNDSDCGMSTNPPYVNYRNIIPPSTAKNAITVGATNSNDNSMTLFSSWGPVDDGRLKPEVVAPGCERDTIRDDNLSNRTIWSTLPGNTYGGECGTSMAAPVVSGISALIVEQYRKMNNNDDPWPSTIKALLVQSAHDMSDGTSWYNPGPDYASGYGLVDAKGAVDLVKARRIRQETISQGESDLINVWVPNGTTQLKVTIAWDDPAGTENANPALVNDLDLALWEPDYTTHNAWKLDPANPAADATTGWDGTNNLEQVLVNNPVSGKWTIYINGFSVPQGPQKYSVVSEAFFDVLEPSKGGQVYAGPFSNPQKVIIQTAKPRDGLVKNQFQVKIGDQPANILTFYEGSDRYVLEIMPTSPASNGSYDLSVSVPDASVWNVIEGAVLFANIATIDTDLVLDRSGSMDGDPITAAKNAAKQFVDLMQNGDKVGVVSFDDVVETNFPLTTITSDTSSTTVFSDNMESGTTKWIADSPWAVTTESAHNGTHAWSDSPSGSYTNNEDISLRTASSIYVPTTTTTPVLAFWQKYELETNFDYGYVEVSTNGGTDWTTLSTFNGTNPNWYRTEVALTSYKGQNVLLRFRLHTDYSVVYDGWYIDDVTVGESNSDTKTLAKTAIDTIYARNTTSIGGGLQQGQQQLSSLGSATDPWAIVLLTDGLENTAPWVADVLPAVKATKTKVYTIGLGAGADEALLLDIATQTGGTYNYAPGPEQLSDIYNTILGSVTDRQTLLAVSGTAQQGVTDQKSVVVDSTVSEATFSINWSNSSNTITLTLSKPNGTVIDPTTAAGNPDIEYISGSTYAYYRIHTPTLVSGTWQMNITGGSITASAGKGTIKTASGEPYTARVTGIANLTLHGSLERNDYLQGQPVKMIATLSDNQPILGAAVTVSIESPSQASAMIRSGKWVEFHGDTIPDPAEAAAIKALNSRSATSLNLFDDGFHGDGIANDGVYANQFTNTSQIGTYLFLFNASGQSNSGGSFTRQSQLSSYIAENLNVIQLDVTKSGTGSGTVTSNPAGIDCGSTCSAFFDESSSVTLNEVPASNSVFTGWEGACSGSGSCVLTMDAAKSVNAVFKLNTPSTPSNLHVLDTTVTSITIGWADVGSENGYKIYKWLFINNSWDFYYLATIGANSTGFTESNLAKNSGNHYYQVSAFNSYGESSRTGWVGGGCFSNGSCDSINGSNYSSSANPDTYNIRPSIPTLRSPKNNALISNYKPRLDWSDSSVPSGTNFQKYVLQLAKDRTFTDPVSVDITGSAKISEYTPSQDLEPNTTYYWRVRSYTTLEQFSPWSPVRYFRTAIPAPTLVDPNKGLSTSNRTPTFAWSKVPGASSYILQVSKSSSFKSSILKVTVTSSMYTSLKNLPMGTYYWRVQAKGPNGPSQWSVTRSFVEK